MYVFSESQSIQIQLISNNLYISLCVDYRYVWGFSSAIAKDIPLFQNHFFVIQNGVECNTEHNKTGSFCGFPYPAGDFLPRMQPTGDFILRAPPCLFVISDFLFDWSPGSTYFGFTLPTLRRWAEPNSAALFLTSRMRPMIHLPAQQTYFYYISRNKNDIYKCATV